MSGCGCEFEPKDQAQTKVLVILLVINALMFAVEIGAGLLSESTALIADSLDMLADASVYALSLYAVGRAPELKARAAYISGLLQIVLGMGVFVEIGRRLLLGSEPQSLFMIGVGALALLANSACLALIAAHRDGEVHMRASWIFSKNDVIANAGVIVGGVLVYVWGARWPDLLIGTGIAVLVMHGGIRILAQARAELPPPKTCGAGACGCKDAQQ